MSRHFEVDFYKDLYVDCVCSKCEENLEVDDINYMGGKITVSVKPCKKCNPNEIGVAVFDTQSPFFKDLMEFTENEFGREAALRLELFALTWHGRNIPEESER